MSSDQRRLLSGPVLTVGTTLCLLGAGYWMHSDLRASAASIEERIDGLSDRMTAMERVIQLYRFEQPAKSGLGFPALLEQLRHFAPLKGLATTPAAQLPEIEERLEAVVSAIAGLGPEVFPDLQRCFEAAEPGTDDELLMWLVRAMRIVDPNEAQRYLSVVLRGMAFVVSPRMRLFAADELTAIAPDVAASLLQNILLTETHNGLDVQRITPQVRAEFPNASETIVPYRGFSTFVQKYVATEADDTEQTLLMVMGRRHQHDFLTLQECVKALGSIGSERGVDAIIGLFENPPRNSSPMFRNHCLDALAAIRGSACCDYLQKALLREQVEIVRMKLTELIKTNCGD